MKIDKLINKDIVLLFFLFLSFFNVLNLGKLILFMTFFCYIIDNLTVVNFKFNIWMFLFCIITFIYTFAYFVYNPNLNSVFNVLYKTIMVFLSCIFAKIIFSKYDYTFFIKVILSIALGLFAYSLVCIVYEISIGSPNLVNPSYRMVYDIWKRVPVTATQVTGNFILITIFPILTFKVKDKKLLCLFLLSVFFISLGLSFYLGSRSFFLIAFIVNAIGIFHLLNRKERLIFLSVILLLFIVFCFILYFDIFNIRTFLFKKTYLFQRILNIDFWLNDPRIRTWILCINNILKFPFGNLNTNIGMEYAHNFLFDSIYSNGLFGLIFCIPIYYNSIKIMLLLLFSKDNKLVKSIVFSIFLSLFMFINFEPVINGYFLIFILFIIVFNYMSMTFEEQPKFRKKIDTDF